MTPARYRSKSWPTQEKKRLFYFLERHEQKKNYVPEREVIKYASRHKLKVIRPHRNWIHIKNSRGSVLAGMHKNKGKVDVWQVN